jgi:hypothetical protein
VTEADLQHLKLFFQRVAEEARAANARSQQAWSIAKRVVLIAVLAAFMAGYYLLWNLHSALAN